ncbi:hypothetical protein D9619_012145 [Psilocybe cf. subviscida]|uniref:Uncharacterized protein n=1 Tax=Psilocybe cf. subviscida TaxID=2480587 RepID=A0A8H5EZL3_9AGAR|nr:hypothetical protein D9619_012145 [Psilocybe cf. subviscida]
MQYHAETSTSGPLTKLDTASLTLTCARLMNSFLPNLRHINAYIHGQSRVSWKIIKDCCNTLETIQVKEFAESSAYEFLAVNFYMFPRLEEFTYTLAASISALEIYPVLFKWLPPVQTSIMSYGLKILNMSLYLIHPAGNPAHNSWVAKLTAAAANSVWVDLDNILAKRHYFPALRRVSITLKVTRIKKGTVDSDALQKEVERALLRTFSASIKASVPLEFTADLGIRT